MDAQRLRDRIQHAEVMMDTADIIVFEKGVGNILCALHELAAVCRELVAEAEKAQHQRDALYNEIGEHHG